MVVANHELAEISRTSPLKWLSIPLDAVYDESLRLEANIYATDAAQAKIKVTHNRYGYVLLKEMVDTCSYPNRFKRNYISSLKGMPFFMPSQMQEINPKPYKFIATQAIKNLGELVVQKNTLLITRSGTVGKVMLVNKSLENGLFSDDIIRLKTKKIFDLSYIYTFFLSKTGNQIIQSMNYGSVIKHIEPEHLLGLPIPNPPESIKQHIHDLITRSFELRDQSNALLNQASQLFKNALQLPDISDFENHDHAPYAFSISSHELAGRFEANYHHPVASRIEQHLQQYAAGVTTLNDKHLTQSITLSPRFKRHYVTAEFGIPFLGGKEILELDPRGDKYLSTKQHKDLIKKISLIPNQILITCSGTIGKVVLVPKHWENWTASQHLLKVIPRDEQIAGYLYLWLSSEWALPLIQRYTYGSVIFEIDHNHLASMPVPLIDAAIMQQISDMVLQMNELRTQAFELEQQALSDFEAIFLHA